MKLTKKGYLQGFGIVVIFLAIVRAVYPSVADDRRVKDDSSDSTKIKEEQNDTDDTLLISPGPYSTNGRSRFLHSDGSVVKNRIYSVPNFGKAFPDQNDIQLISAMKYGVSPVMDRADAEKRKSELVYIGSSPYYHVDKLRNSIPYLVPKASILLHDIGRNFFDSLQIKGIPLHKIIVTSVLRSKADIDQLRGHNQNAKPNSCHLYGTTFDVCYNRYKTVEAPGGPKMRKVRNDTLKWVLSEVLNDMRERGMCHIKYEVHQGCFHITVK